MGNKKSPIKTTSCLCPPFSPSKLRRARAVCQHETPCTFPFPHPYFLFSSFSLSLIPAVYLFPNTPGKFAVEFLPPPSLRSVFSFLLFYPTHIAETSRGGRARSFDRPRHSFATACRLPRSGRPRGPSLLLPRERPGGCGGSTMMTGDEVSIRSSQYLSLYERIISGRFLACCQRSGPSWPWRARQEGERKREIAGLASYTARQSFQSFPCLGAYHRPFPWAVSSLRLVTPKCRSDRGKGIQNSGNLHLHQLSREAIGGRKQRRVRARKEEDAG